MIGLLTPYSVNNYGTKLQAYAVQEIVREYDDVEIINYRPSIIGRAVRKFEKMFVVKKYFDSKICSSNGNVPISKLKERSDAINSFDYKLIISKQICGFSKLKKYSLKYRTVVCGSDQIWNPVNLPEHIYMLEFVPDKVKKVAIAPSFGIPALPDSLKSVYRRKLKRFDSLSVRELSGCQIVRSLGFDDVFHLLDPTLILDEKKWKILSNEYKANLKTPYIFCYFLGSHDYGRNAAKEIKRKTGYSIVNIQHFKGYVSADENFADYNLYDVSPENFISLIKNAAYICTDSFHGTAFSVIFEKDFFCFERHKTVDEGNTNDRLYSILKILGLEDRLINSLNMLPLKLGEPVQYERVKAVLNEYRDKAKEYLSNALKED